MEAAIERTEASFKLCTELLVFLKEEAEKHNRTLNIVKVRLTECWKGKRCMKC